MTIFAKSKFRFSNVVLTHCFLITCNNGLKTGVKCKNCQRNIKLTDLYPNPAFVARINSQDINHIKYHHLSDATNISEVPKGLKTHSSTDKPNAHFYLQKP